MKVFALIIVSLFFISSNVMASEPDAIVGVWQSADAGKAKPRYRAIYINKFNNLKMVECKITADQRGEQTNAVVCDVAPQAGVSLKFNPSNENYKVVNHGLTSITLKDQILTEKKTFGFVETKWQKANPEVNFLFYNVELNYSF